MKRLICIDRYDRDYDTRKLKYLHSLYFCNGKRISMARFLAITFLRCKPIATIKIAGSYFDIKNYYEV